MSKDQEEIDFGLDNYMAELDDDLSFVDVGILSKDGAKKHGPTSDGKQSDITMAELATIQEFGTVINVTPKMRKFLSATGLNLSPETKVITIPSRPFMRQTFDEQESELGAMAEKLDRDILTKQTSRRAALNQLGQSHRQEIQKNMSTSGKFKANHPYTVARKKGKSMPLIDSGAMRQAIDFEVG